MFNFLYICIYIIRILFQTSNTYKKEIFTFIFLHSLKLLKGIVISPSTISYLICYLTENPINFELVHKHYIILALVVPSFPFIKILNLSEYLFL